jgi:hypothetical protein
MEQIYDEAGALMGNSVQELAERLGITLDAARQRVTRVGNMLRYQEPSPYTSAGDPIYDVEGNYLGESLQEVANRFGVRRQAIWVRIEQRDGYRVMMPKKHDGPKSMSRLYRGSLIKTRLGDDGWALEVHLNSTTVYRPADRYATMSEAFDAAKSWILELDNGN